MNGKFVVWASAFSSSSSRETRMRVKYANIHWEWGRNDKRCENNTNYRYVTFLNLKALPHSTRYAYFKGRAFNVCTKILHFKAEMFARWKANWVTSARGKSLSENNSISRLFPLCIESFADEGKVENLHKRQSRKTNSAALPLFRLLRFKTS